MSTATNQNSNDNVWFIVGASNGFGRAIALEALSRGDKVVACSRNVAKMTADLGGGGVGVGNEEEKKGSSSSLLILELDITSDDETLRSALRKGMDEYGTITHLINAAGYILEGPVEGASPQEILSSFQTNVFGVMNMTRLSLEMVFRPRGQGVIANFGSLASWGGGPAWAYYGAAKWAVSGFTEALHAEVKPLGVDAVVIEPGYFRTGFLNGEGNNRIKMKKGLEEEYKDTDVPKVRRMLDEADDNQPGDVGKGARVIVDVLTGKGKKKIPMRLLLGSDVRDAVRGKLESTGELIREWEDVIVSTDY